MRKREGNRLDLREAFPVMPEECYRALMDAACSVKEESVVKHRLVRVAVLAAALVCLVAVACAAFAPQLTALFGQMYGHESQQWLEGGDIALPAQSIETDHAVFTLEEVIYRNRGLYALGTITPKAGAVLLPEDFEPTAAWGYDVHGAGGSAEAAPEGAPTYLEKAAEEGALVSVHVRLDAVGVDGGEVLPIDCGGYALIPQRDGSVRFYMEAEGGTAIEEGSVYTLALLAVEHLMDEQGEQVENGRNEAQWTVEIAPTPIAEN